MYFEKIADNFFNAGEVNNKEDTFVKNMILSLNSQDISAKHKDFALHFILKSYMQQDGRSLSQNKDIKLHDTLKPIFDNMSKDENFINSYNHYLSHYPNLNAIFLHAIQCAGEQCRQEKNFNLDENTQKILTSIDSVMAKQHGKKEMVKTLSSAYQPNPKSDFFN